MIKVTPLKGPLGIVGADETKFTRKGEDTTQLLIRRLITKFEPTMIVSGACPAGGVDIWAEDAALEMGIPYLIFPPKENGWRWYRKRNLQIAHASALVACIALDRGPKWSPTVYCYHHKSDTHVGNGGCWTAIHAKKTKLYIVKNFDDHS